MVETGNKFHDNVSRLISWGHWFTFFNLIIVSVISLRYVKYAGLSDSGLGIAYQFISLLGHFSFLSAVFFGLILFPLAFILPSQRFFRLSNCLISSIVIAFLIFDTQIFKLYNFHLNPLIWQFLQRPEQVEQIYSINLHYIAIPIIFAIELLLSYLVWNKLRFFQVKRIGKPIAFFLLSTFIFTHLIFIWADANQYRPITQEKSIYPLSYPMTARTFLKKQGWLNDDQLLKHTNQQNTNKISELNYPITPLIYQPTAELSTAKNVLFITTDALRSEMLNEKNMPFLYKISQQGLTYKNHFSGASNRPQGLFSLFYGLPNRYWFEVTLNFIPPVLISRLKEQNYQFGLFSSIGFLHPEFLQSTFSQIKTKELTRHSASNNDVETTKKWKSWLKEQDAKKNWFSFLYYGQSNRSEAKNVTTSLAARSEELSSYQQRILSTDNEIDQIISTLRDNNQLDNTIVIITGTHGESFEKQSNVEAAITNAHVPLVILWPGKEASEITRMTSHVDIVPTLMEELLGTVTKADQYSSGQSLFDDNERRYLLSGDLSKYIIYEKDKITQFSNSGDISSIDWKGQALENEEVNITLFIDVLSKLRNFNSY